MITDSLPCCFIPSKIVVVDDDPGFLDSFDLAFNNMQPFQTFDNPKSAVKFFLNEYKPHSYLDQCLNVDDEVKSDHAVYDYNLRKICYEIYNSKRFDLVPVIISDYAMPGLNGIDMYRTIKDIQAKKILLTGIATQNDAVQAFNEGIIDKFIFKNPATMISELKTAISELTYQFYLDLSHTIVGSLITSEQQKLTCLNDPAFVKFFHNLCNEQYIIEYYLADEYGSFILLDKKGQLSILAVKSEKDLAEYYDFTQDTGNVPNAITDALKSRKKIPFFFSDTDYNTPPHKWEKFLHPVSNSIQGQSTYYTAYISDPSIYDIDSDRILTFLQYSAG